MDPRDASLDRRDPGIDRREVVANETVTSRATVGPVSDRDLVEVLGRVLGELARVVGATAGVVFVRDADDGPLKTRVVLIHRRLASPETPARRRSPFASSITDGAWHGWSPLSGAALSDEFVVRSERSAGTRRRPSRRIVGIPLKLGDRTIGFIALAPTRDRATVPDEAALSMMRVLAQQATLAIRLATAVEDARSRAVAVEQARAAGIRTKELQRVSSALQHVIDAVSGMNALESFIPVALQIVATAFNAADTAYFEYPQETVRLRYWYGDGRTHGPDELLALPGERYASIRAMARGFEVPPGVSPTEFHRARPPEVMNHRRATEWPRRHDICVALGWDWELSVPLVVNGHADGALTIYRREDFPFSDDEISLAESFGKQISLAIQATRIAEREQLVRVAQERQQSVQRRAEELAAANEALRSSAERLVALEQLDDYLDGLIRAAVPLSDAVAGCIVLVEEERHQLRMVTLIDDSGAEGALMRASFPTTSVALEGEAFESWLKIKGASSYWWADSDAGGFTDEFRAYHRVRGHRGIAHLVMRFRDDNLGFFSLAFRSAEQPNDSRLQMFAVLANQAALAIGVTRLADHAKSVASREAVTEERNRMAGEIHDNLAQSFTSIAMQSEALMATLHDDGERDSRFVENPDAARRRVLQVLTLIERTARLGQSEARSSSIALRPSSTSPPLEAALASLAERSEVAGQVTCRLAVVGLVRAIDADRQTSLVRIAQEAIGNALRHSGARNIRLLLDYATDVLHLVIEDDGQGLPEEGVRHGRGFGLVGMAARAEAMGGSFLVRDVAPHGVRVSVDVPLSIVDAKPAPS